MQIVDSVQNNISKEPVSVALGRFDGVHLGHRAVIRAALEFPCARPAVFTFESSPRGVITGEMVYSLLTLSQKREMMRSLGVELYVCPPFGDVRDMMPEEFVILLKERLNAVHISCGFNFTFGVSGRGNAAALKEICARHGIALTVVPPIEAGGEPVSASAVRAYIESGDMESASRLLGYRFRIDFPVLQGDQRGRTLDFPTINQKIPPNFIHPKYGVYATKTVIGGRVYKSVSNVGVRPTVGADYPRCETHIIGYSGDLYGQNITVEFYRFLRPEISFSDISELGAAIANDRQTVVESEY